MIATDLYFPATGMPDKDWWHALWPNPEEVAAKTGIRRSMTIVDLCCGDGYFTAPIARLASPGRVLAIDLDQPLLQEARAACRGLSNCTFVEADARNLRELVAEPVDYVFIANTFHGVPDKTELARAVVAVLKPAGRFAVINWYPLPRDQTMVLGKPRGPAAAMRMSPDAVREVVEPAGFALERVVELPPITTVPYLQRGPHCSMAQRPAPLPEGAWTNPLIRWTDVPPASVICL